MSLNIVVLAKQVPDTRNVGKDAMKEDGTINRAALPAIFNPEDLNALEQALQLKDQNPGSRITLLTMGPPRASEIIREGLYRGADTGIVLTSRAFAGADTLATSYAIAAAVKHIKQFDIVIGGRQAIDGDTAQVGPQVAEKLGIPQVTYAEEIIKVENGVATIKRRLKNGVETVEAPLPLVVTVNGSAAPCRPRNARFVQKYKYAVTPSEKANLGEDMLRLVDSREYLNLYEWDEKVVEADVEQIGLAGSPTKVKGIENVVFTAKESKVLDGGNDAEIEDLIKELITNHTIG
ncbi:MAG: electron transfer flavoprotein subunit beta/FixA family protein [Muribaculaceae bacterium]|nr:electron transfer flavoprotein subunit beta/FixA family protein [Muribaculaceae bacterium]MDY3933813.1 electron transfer flavoprotein subunit beta/FixA family protein [Muribaculaceae bacterium]